MNYINVKIKNDAVLNSELNNKKFSWNTKKLPHEKTGNIQLLDETNTFKAEIPIQQVYIIHNEEEYRVFMTERDNKNYSVYAIAGEVNRTDLLTSIQNNDDKLNNYQTIKVSIHGNKTSVVSFDLRELSPIY
jgi:hypothetical protein